MAYVEPRIRPMRNSPPADEPNDEPIPVPRPTYGPNEQKPFLMVLYETFEAKFREKEKYTILHQASLFMGLEMYTQLAYLHELDGRENPDTIAAKWIDGEWGEGGLIREADDLIREAMRNFPNGEMDGETPPFEVFQFWNKWLSSPLYERNGN